MTKRERIYLEGLADILDKRSENVRFEAGHGDKSDSTYDVGRARGLEDAAIILRMFLRNMDEDAKNGLLDDGDLNDPKLKDKNR